MPYGFTVPFEKASGSVGWLESTQTPYQAAIENVKSLLITNWGERPMHYNLGCNLAEFLFQPERTTTIKGQISDRVVSQMNLWLPFIVIDGLNVLFPADDPTQVPENGMKIQLAFHLTTNPNQIATIEQPIVA